MKENMSAKGGSAFGGKPKFIVVVLVLILAVFIGRHFKKQPQTLDSNKQSSVTSQEKPKSVDVLPAINGELVNAQTAGRRPIAVMVENFPEARPQSGLTEADLVYEAPTEGGITRFMAVYQTNTAKNIGPIRSARVYFADLANELGAVYAHVGGNSDALANIKSGVYKNISDADQFFNDPYFKRVTWRQMPHNVYTSIDKLHALISKHNFLNEAQYQQWNFKNDLVELITADKILIDFSRPEYKVQYIFDPTTDSYQRQLAGKPHKDRDSGKVIETKNIIVQFVKTFPTKTDTLLSIGMDLTSGGKANVFLDGKVFEGTWKKLADDRTRYYDHAGNEISFNRGTTWVELVPDGQIVSWK